MREGRIATPEDRIINRWKAAVVDLGLTCKFKDTRLGMELSVGIRGLWVLHHGKSVVCGHDICCSLPISYPE